MQFFFNADDIQLEMVTAFFKLISFAKFNFFKCLHHGQIGLSNGRSQGESVKHGGGRQAMQ